MTNRSTILDDTLAALRSAGLTPEVGQGSQHLQVHFKNQFGQRCLVIISRGARQPNWRALQENRAVLRRLPRSPGLVRAVDNSSSGGDHHAR